MSNYRKPNALKVDMYDLRNKSFRNDEYYNKKFEEGRKKREKMWKITLKFVNKCIEEQIILLLNSGKDCIQIIEQLNKTETYDTVKLNVRNALAKYNNSLSKLSPSLVISDKDITDGMIFRRYNEYVSTINPEKIAIIKNQSSSQNDKDNGDNNEMEPDR